jgi:IS1 family transposase
MRPLKSMKFGIFVKKTNKEWVYIVFDGVKKLVVDYQVGDRDILTFDKVYQRIKQLNIKTIHTDNFNVYQNIEKDLYKHTTTKNLTPSD